jgi:hypothetical protein
VQDLLDHMLVGHRDDSTVYSDYGAILLVKTNKILVPMLICGRELSNYHSPVTAKCLNLTFYQVANYNKSWAD